MATAEKVDFIPRIAAENDPTGPGRQLWRWYFPNGESEFHGVVKLVPVTVTIKEYSAALRERFGIAVSNQEITLGDSAADVKPERSAAQHSRTATKIVRSKRQETITETEEISVEHSNPISPNPVVVEVTPEKSLAQVEAPKESCEPENNELPKEYASIIPLQTKAQVDELVAVVVALDRADVDGTDATWERLLERERDLGHEISQHQEAKQIVDSSVAEWLKEWWPEGNETPASDPFTTDMLEAMMPLIQKIVLGQLLRHEQQISDLKEKHWKELRKPTGPTEAA